MGSILSAIDDDYDDLRFEERYRHNHGIVSLVAEQKRWNKFVKDLTIDSVCEHCGSNYTKKPDNKFLQEQIKDFKLQWFTRVDKSGTYLTQDW